MNDAEFLASLKRDFVADVLLEAEAWEENLLEIENAGSHEACEDFQRRVHSMKGSSGAIGLEELNAALHSLESRMTEAPLDGGTLEQRRVLLTPYFEFVDRLREWANAASSGQAQAEATAYQKLTSRA